VWDTEVFAYFQHLSTGVLWGSKAKRLAELAKPKQIYIINHDGVGTILAELCARRDIDCVVIDEVAAFRNARSTRWKNMNALLMGRKYAWGLTGSPTPQAPTDAYGQVKLLLPARVPKYFNEFQRRVMMQVSQFRWVPKRDAKEQVYDMMQPAVRYKRDDCVELPPVIYQHRSVPLSKEQDRVYHELMKKLKLNFQEGTLVAVNEGVLYGKLLQITSGWVYTHNRNIVDLDPAPRLEALMEILDEAEGKVIVFVDYIHAAERVHQALVAAGYDATQVSGKTPVGERNLIFNAFQKDASPRVLVAHPKCMSHGLTLTAANVIVWYTPTTSLETYEQACARITRPGQQRKSLIVHLTGTPVESKLYRRLQQKASVQGALLEMFE
jgi:SNF2 family DNA or RNA helicase